MLQDLKTHIEKVHLFKIHSLQPLSGGDINAVYLLNTTQGNFVLKLNSTKKLPDMFKKEAAGLVTLSNTNCIDVPKVIGFGEQQGSGFLLLDYKEQGEARFGFWEDFGRRLAKLHLHTRRNFGFEDHNVIGSLVQYNYDETTASDFFIKQRLKPQFELASKKGFDFKHLSTFYENIEQEIPDEIPALIHGDLWSGNFLVNSEGRPCLIDPAVAYAPREMDLAMMKLFGGFEERIFQAYHEVFPLELNWKQRISLWQLYYLLVHLNIFGVQYYNKCKAIIKEFS